MQTAGGGVIAILQARMNSSRLPGKVLRPVNGKPLIEWQIRRIQESKFISKLVLATSTDGSDDDLNDVRCRRKAGKQVSDEVME